MSESDPVRDTLERLADAHRREHIERLTRPEPASPAAESDQAGDYYRPRGQSPGYGAMARDLVSQDVADVPGRRKGSQEQEGCPDDGACHHLCRDRCWRVSFCAPLSGYGEDWTAADRKRHAPDAP